LLQVIRGVLPLAKLLKDLRRAEGPEQVFRYPPGRGLALAPFIPQFCFGGAT
jgi:hypothetical protein